LAPLPDGYEKIMRSVFDCPDPNSVYEEVVEGIKAIKPSRASMSELLDALDRAQTHVLKARGLLINAKVTIDAAKRDAAPLENSMRDAATARLEAEKEAGSRKKAITEADVSSMMATLYPDEWAAVQYREARTRRTIALFDELCTIAAERARDLRAIVSASRSV
jgi:hypothetical protein